TLANDQHTCTTTGVACSWNGTCAQTTSGPAGSPGQSTCQANRAAGADGGGAIPNAGPTGAGVTGTQCTSLDAGGDPQCAFTGSCAQGAPCPGTAGRSEE